MRPITRSPLYKDVLARLEELVARSEMAPGDRLPGERELALELGISRNSLRPALAALEALGVIEIHHGKGAFLRTTSVGHVAECLSIVLLRESRDLPAALEARMGLERFAAGLAAGRRDERDLERMEAALQAMDDDVRAGGIGAAADEEFHAAVVAASQNPVLSRLLAELRDPIQRIREESLSQRGRPHRSLEAHRRILDAIRRRNAAAAVAAVDAHLTEVGDTPLLRSAVADRDRVSSPATS
jgi:GntR family transcriptional repressor for pyruvate dehydrogenase complex